MMFFAKKLAILMAVCPLAALIGVSQAQADAGIFCVRSSGGVVNFRSRTACLRGERQLLVFGTRGSAGPQGPQGPVGPQGSQGAPAPDSFAADSSAPSNSVFVDSSGKLGVGTTTPESPLTIAGGQLEPTSTFGVGDVTFPSPLLVLRPPDGTHLIKPGSGVQNILQLKVQSWFRGQSTGSALTFGDFGMLSRIVHYSDTGNSTGSRLQLQTNLATAYNTWSDGVKIYENGAVTVGVPGDPTGAPGDPGDLILGNYLQLAAVSGTPPATDCDSASERGRMKVDTAAGVLWICMDLGWISK